ncbi:hypothetical protein SK128_018047 [Halocaridina rubra]|uniref:Uncharacterized protein n=1 Tax=Halocaridina rubra TaxID=373956 RepID=A0AAN9FTV8_HALRR
MKNYPPSAAATNTTSSITDTTTITKDICIPYRVTHTRQMLLSVEQQCKSLSESVSVLQLEKEHHTTVQADVLEKLQGLTESFENLSLLSETKLQKVVTHAEKKIEQLQNVEIDLNDNLEKKEIENSQLRENLNEQDRKIAGLKEDLDSSLKIGKECEENFVQTKIKLDEVQESLCGTRKSFTDEIQKNEELSEELKELHSKLTESRSEFNEAVEKIQMLKKSNDELEGCKSELQTKVEALANCKQELEQVYQLVLYSFLGCRFA